MTINATDQQSVTKRRLRQFGIRDLMLVSACLAVTPGLYRDAYPGLAMQLGRWETAEQ